MAVTIHVGKSETEYRIEPHVVFWRTWIKYFSEFEPSYKLYTLAQIPLFEDKVFDLEFCRQLQTEIPKLLFMVKLHSLPSFPPQTDTEDEFWEGATFDYKEAKKFFMALSKVVDTAVSEKTSIITIGD